jgi:syntaxin-binding protein 5
MLTTGKQARIDSVHLARQSLECAVVLQTGEVVVYRLSSGPREDVPRQGISDKELIFLEHIPPCRGRRYYPFLMVVPEKGRVTAFAISDIGTIFHPRLLLFYDLIWHT